MRRGETAARHFLVASSDPGHPDVLAAGGEFHELTEAAEKNFGLGATGKIDGDDTGKMAGPFAFEEIFVVAGGDDMAAESVGFIYPIFVKQHLVFASAAEAAVQDMVAAFERLADAFPDDESAGAEMFAQDAEAANLGLRRQLANDAGDSGAVAINIAALTGDGRDLQA